MSPTALSSAPNRLLLLPRHPRQLSPCLFKRHAVAAARTVPPGVRPAHRGRRRVGHGHANAICSGAGHAGRASWAAAELGAARVLALGVEVAVLGVDAGFDECGIVAFAHVAEGVRGAVYAPELVGAGDEFAVLVPALDPGDAVVEAEEAHVYVFAALVGNGAVGFAHLVLGLQEVALEDSGPVGWNGTVEFDILFGVRGHGW